MPHKNTIMVKKYTDYLILCRDLYIHQVKNSLYIIRCVKESRGEVDVLLPIVSYG